MAVSIGEKPNAFFAPPVHPPLPSLRNPPCFVFVSLLRPWTSFDISQDMIQIGRCERMVVIAGDDASGEALLPWVGNGFRALGASSIAADPADAALPFDARRNGMILGAGGIGMVLETEVGRRLGGHDVM